RASSSAAPTAPATPPRTGSASAARASARSSGRSSSRSRTASSSPPRSRPGRSPPGEREPVGIDYVVDYDCEPKRALGLDRILEILKDRSRAAAALEVLRERGEADRPLDAIEFEFVARTPDGDLAPRRVNVKDVLLKAAALEEFAPACEECPANNSG